LSIIAECIYSHHIEHTSLWNDISFTIQFQHSRTSNESRVISDSED